MTPPTLSGEGCSRTSTPGLPGVHQVRTRPCQRKRTNLASNLPILVEVVVTSMASCPPPSTTCKGEKPQHFSPAYTTRSAAARRGGSRALGKPPTNSADPTNSRAGPTPAPEKFPPPRHTRLKIRGRKALFPASDRSKVPQTHPTVMLLSWTGNTLSSSYLGQRRSHSKTVTMSKLILT